MGSRLGDGVGGTRLAAEQNGGGGVASGDVLGADGITVTGTGPLTLHNDLVTGVDVANLNVDVDAAGSARIDATSGNGKGILLTAANAGGDNILQLGVGPGATGLTALLTGVHAVLQGDGDARVVGGDVSIQSAPGTNGILIDTNGGGSPAAGEIAVLADTGIVVTAGAGGAGVAGNVTITGGAGASGLISITAQGNNNIQLATAGTGDVVINPNHDELHTIGRNFVLTTAGSGGISIVSDHATAPLLISSDGNLSLLAGFDGGAGDILIDNHNGNGDIDIIAATQLSLNGDNIKLFDGTGTGQWAVIADASGGSVIDAEARTALNALLANLRLRGDLNT